MSESRRIVEVNGVKLEIDMSTAKRVDEFKIGDNVKVLMKEYCDSYKVLPGVIIEFVNFQKLPTIVVATFETSYSGCELSFTNYNSQSEDIEISLCSDHELKLEKNRVIDKLNKEAETKRGELEDIENKKDYFVEHFSKYFNDNNKEC